MTAGFFETDFLFRAADVAAGDFFFRAPAPDRVPVFDEADLPDVPDEGFFFAAAFFLVPPPEGGVAFFFGFGAEDSSCRAVLPMANWLFFPEPRGEYSPLASLFFFTVYIVS